jgi:hypothetical protein
VEQGVIERARCVDVWKGFVKEATEAFLYSDLGGLLVRIQAVSLNFITPLHACHDEEEENSGVFLQFVSCCIKHLK